MQQLATLLFVWCLLISFSNSPLAGSSPQDGMCCFSCKLLFLLLSARHIQLKQVNTVIQSWTTNALQVPLNLPALQIEPTALQYVIFSIFYCYNLHHRFPPTFLQLPLTSCQKQHLSYSFPLNHSPHGGPDVILGLCCERYWYEKPPSGSLDVV